MGRSSIVISSPTGMLRTDIDATPLASEVRAKIRPLRCVQIEVKAGVKRQRRAERLVDGLKSICNSTDRISNDPTSRPNAQERRKGGRLVDNLAGTKQAVGAALVAVAMVLLGATAGKAEVMSERHHEGDRHHTSGSHRDGADGRDHHRRVDRPNVIYWIPYTPYAYYWPSPPTYPPPTWYYCPTFATYYPYVVSCPDAWVPVPSS